jgi:hypothetical protein
MTNSRISDILHTGEEPETEARIVTFTICVAIPFKPEEEQVQKELAQIVRVAVEGMKMQVVSAQALVLTIAQARKAFELAEKEDAIEQSKVSTKQ